MPLSITSNFDSGAIEVIRAERADDLHVRIRNDSHADFAQWFHFRLSGARDTPCVLTFDNASNASYPRGWEGYNVAASYDHEHWFRLPSTYDGTALQVRFNREKFFAKALRVFVSPLQLGHEALNLALRRRGGTLRVFATQRVQGQLLITG